MKRGRYHDAILYIMKRMRAFKACRSCFTKLATGSRQKWKQENQDKYFVRGDFDEEATPFSIGGGWHRRQKMRAKFRSDCLLKL